MFYCVISDLCAELIAHADGSYRKWCVCVISKPQQWDGLRPESGCSQYVLFLGLLEDGSIGLVRNAGNYLPIDMTNAPQDVSHYEHLVPLNIRVLSDPTIIIFYCVCLYSWKFSIPFQLRQEFRVLSS